MATLKCLACGHDNNVGDESCSSCSSSLNLKLCSACEAINANNAERCHSCNAEFRVEPEAVTFELDVPPAGELAEAAPRAGKALPAVWRIATDHARRRSNWSAAALAILPLLAAGLAYYFYSVSGATQEPQAALEVEVVQKPEPNAKPEAARDEPARPRVAEPAQVRAPAPAVSGKIAPSRTAAAPPRSRTAAAPPRSTPAPEPKRTTARVTHTSVTHTRGAGADAPSRTAAVEPSTRTAADAALPLVATRPVPAANAGIIPVSEAPAAISEPKAMSVTHTKADPTEAAVTTTVPAAVTQVRTVPGEARNDEPAGCAPAVAALGLCRSR